MEVSESESFVFLEFLCVFGGVVEGAAVGLFGVGGVSEQLAVLDVADGDPGDDD